MGFPIKHGGSLQFFSKTNAMILRIAKRSGNGSLNKYIKLHAQTWGKITYVDPKPT